VQHILLVQYILLINLFLLNMKNVSETLLFTYIYI